MIKKTIDGFEWVRVDSLKKFVKAHYLGIDQEVLERFEKELK